MAGRSEHGANRQESAGGAPRTAYDFTGPTYSDARQLAADMERLHGRTIGFLFGPGDMARRWESGLLHVRAYALGQGNDFKGADWGGAYHGGNRGAKTLPGALIQALHNLDEALAVRWLSDAEPSPQGGPDA